jgi:hypothetical protein
MLEQELYKRAIKLWGKTAQIDMAIEEMAELTQALCKIKRKTQPKGIIYNLFEEIADVEIMLEQLKIIFNCEDIVLEYKDQKLERLEKRILEGEKA